MATKVKTKPETITSDIDTIELLPNEQVLVVCKTREAAMRCLRRNPRGSAMPSSEDGDERVALVYSLNETNIINAIKRG